MFVRKAEAMSMFTSFKVVNFRLFMTHLQYVDDTLFK